MAFVETYSNSIDFPNGLIAGQLFGEIEASVSITSVLNNVADVPGDNVEISFDSALSAPEKTALDGLVAAHTPSLNETVNSIGFVEISSDLADPQAVRIANNDVSGGINVDAGIGGLDINSTNAVSIDAAAASNFTTSAGNLNMIAGGVACVEGGGGIHIGANNDAQAINIGTSVSARPITIGNQNTTTRIDMRAGTGGFHIDPASGGTISLDATGAACNWSLFTSGDNQDMTIGLFNASDSSIILTSAGTGVDAIRLFSSGGIDVDCGTSGFDLDTTGQVNFATSQAAGGAITLDATSGGVTINGGPFGVAINSGGNLIGVGHWNGGEIQIGTAAVARTVTIGNVTGTTALNLNSGTGGIAIGNNETSGEIHLGNSSTAKTLIIGNNTGGSRTFFRRGTGGFIRSQPTPTSLGDSDATLTIGQLLTEILHMNPTVDRTLTFPTAALAVAGISGVQVGDSISFKIINEASTAADPAIIVAMGTGGTFIGGSADVEPYRNNAGTYFSSGTGSYVLHFTNVTASTEAYTVYRV